MKRIIKLLVILFLSLFAISCAKDIVDLTGSIQGTVKDYDSGELLGNCRVSLSPGGESASTDANGSFSFDDLEPGGYTLSFSKSGYSDETQDVTVVTGQTSKVTVYLMLPSATTGKIAGTIKDYKNGQLISNCKVSLTPSGKSVTSSSSGTYEFVDLNPGQYSVSFTKAGYDDENTTVTVIAGKTTTSDALLKAKASFALSETSYDFGDLEVSKTFYFFNYSDTDCSYSILNIPSWLSFDKTNGTVAASGNVAVTAYVDRGKVSEGSYSQNVTITYAGKESGSENLSIKMKKVVLTTPTVSIASSAENVKQNSFDISGSITATGGSQITNYGHCWNTTGNPTINDNKTDLGTSDAMLTFKSTASNLNTYTTYYVRAYAKNAQGIAYSDVIAVTTQDVASDKWDGNIASSFAGGSGTYADPYIIKTGGQLLLVKNYSDSFFELGGNIDLDNKNWLPFNFNGTLDGKGYSISNLYIKRTDNYIGLFAKCSGTVKNLTIRKVDIQASNNNYVGVISGDGGTIINCHVIFGAESQVVGKDYVGGISGGDATISDCSVESLGVGGRISGSSSVGGIIGCSGGIFKNCHVRVSISGSSNVGGVVGYGMLGGEITACSFSGTIIGEDCVGGIVGKAYHNSVAFSLIACKANVELTAEKGSGGGLIGDAYANYFRLTIISSYATGTVRSTTGYTGGLVGFCQQGVYLEVIHSYSAISGPSTNYYGLGFNVRAADCATISSNLSTSYYISNSMSNCTDITTFLKECYSEYADYWNFNKSWTWEGTVDGNMVKVSCPVLSWE